MLEPQVPVQPGGVVLLDDEPRPAAAGAGSRPRAQAWPRDRAFARTRAGRTAWEDGTPGIRPSCRRARSGTARSPSGWSTSRSSSTPRPSRRRCTSTRCTRATAPRSSTGASARRRARRSPTRRSSRATRSPRASTSCSRRTRSRLPRATAARSCTSRSSSTADDIDPVFYEKTYYVGSRDDEDPYRLLLEALRRSRACRHRPLHLPRPRVPRGGPRARRRIALHTLRFHDEVVSRRRARDRQPGGEARRKREVEMAGRLRRDARRGLRPGGLRGHLPRVRARPDQGARPKGKEIDLAAQEEPEHGDDLMAALEASLWARS